MRRNKFFTATNAMHQPDSWRAGACSSFFSCPLSFSFLHMTKMEEGRKHDGPSKEEAATESGLLVDIEAA